MQVDCSPKTRLKRQTIEKFVVMNTVFLDVLLTFLRKNDSIAQKQFSIQPLKVKLLPSCLDKGYHSPPDSFHCLLAQLAYNVTGFGDFVNGFDDRRNDLQQKVRVNQDLCVFLENTTKRVVTQQPPDNSKQTQVKRDQNFSRKLNYFQLSLNPQKSILVTISIYSCIV